MGEYVDRICLRHILAVNVWVYCVSAAQFIICVYIRIIGFRVGVRDSGFWFTFAYSVIFIAMKYSKISVICLTAVRRAVAVSE